MFLDNCLRYFRWKKAINLVKKFPQKSVICDIGSGSKGDFLRKTSSFVNKGFGFDKNAEIYYDAKIELKKLDLEKDIIPLEEETVDIVTMLAVVEHLEKPGHILKEIFRILKPDGFLILTTPSLRAKPILNFLATIKLIHQKDILEHKKYYSLKELESLLLRSGFQKEDMSFKYFELGFNILVIAKK